MGAICGKGQPVAQAEDEERTKASELDRRIRQENKEDENVHKLLLLGAGESGKSTIFKQIKVLYQTGFNDSELKNYIPVIHANVYQSIKILCDGCMELARNDQSGKYDLKPENKELGRQFAEIGETADYPALNKEHAEIIEKIWNDPAIQATYRRANALQLPDCTEYFLKDVHRLAQPGYTPTKDDVLHARVRTTGIADIEFSHGKQRYRLFDVGGQRNERRKWIHLFDGVRAVVFCAALSEYDQNLFEDESRNRMMETKELFEWVLQHPSFKKTSFVVFLNKYDIFQKKVLSVPLNVCEWFRDYEPVGGEQARRVDHAFEYIKRKFNEIYQRHTPELGTTRLCRFYETTALDPNLMKTTFDLVDKALVIESLNVIDRW